MMMSPKINKFLLVPGGYLSRHLLFESIGSSNPLEDGQQQDPFSPVPPVHIPHPRNPSIHAYDAQAAMHRHPRDHSFEGLPTSFWASFIFFIVIFHLFLAKLIYNEFFNRNSHMIPAVNYERLRTLRYTV